MLIIGMELLGIIHADDEDRQYAAYRGAAKLSLNPAFEKHFVHNDTGIIDDALRSIHDM
jgi:hypothetical protein